jgi:1,3-beta-glucan synthase
MSIITCNVPFPRSREDFGESVKRIAKKIQGALPIVGLLSRLAAPEGGFDETVSS